MADSGKESGPMLVRSQKRASDAPRGAEDNSERRPPSAKAETNPSEQTAAQQYYSKSRLSVVPFAVLLPQLGEVAQLLALKERIAAHMRDLEYAEGTGRGEESSKERVSEEAMLSQVIQWLSLGGE